jgi:hypothetical protein
MEILKTGHSSKYQICNLKGVIGYYIIGRGKSFVNSPEATEIE